MLVLLTNDDGIRAEGLGALIRAFQAQHDVWVVAPESEQSGSSHKLTLDMPLRLNEYGDNRYSITGTPTDCVYVAIHHLMPTRPDMILSGLNHGANMGDDVTYSGTVAAAIEGAVLGIDSIACSLASHDSLAFDEAAKAMVKIAEHFHQKGIPERTLINVNIPAGKTLDEMKTRYTKTGIRNYSQSVIQRVDPRGKKYYWIGGSVHGAEDIEGSDLNAVKQGYISVTPVSIDMTAHDVLARELTNGGVEF